MKVKICTVDGCERRAEGGLGYCKAHYQRVKAGKPLDYAPIRKVRRVTEGCLVQGCMQPHHCRKYCRLHYHRLRKTGAAGAVESKQGQGFVTKGGYRRIGRKFEHRIIMEEILGRELTADEQVHHLNGDRLDNAPENLELWSTSQPSGQRLQDKLAWCRAFLARYEESND